MEDLTNVMPRGNGMVWDGEISSRRPLSPSTFISAPVVPAPLRTIPAQAPTVGSSGTAIQRQANRSVVCATCHKQPSAHHPLRPNKDGQLVHQRGCPKQ